MNHILKHTLILVALLMGLASCSPRIAIPDVTTTTIVQRDTVTEIRDRVLTDTVLLAGEEITVLDTVECPPGLIRDSIIYRSKTVYLPGKEITVEVPVTDTFRVVEIRNNIPNYPSGGGWPERLVWLGSVLLLLFGFWKKWKKEQAVAALIALCYWAPLGAQQPARQVTVQTDSGAVQFINGVGIGMVHLVYRHDTIAFNTNSFTLPESRLEDRVASVIQLLHNGRLTWIDFLNANQVRNCPAMRNYYCYARKMYTRAGKALPPGALEQLEAFICVEP